MDQRYQRSGTGFNLSMNGRDGVADPRTGARAHSVLAGGSHGPVGPVGPLAQVSPRGQVSPQAPQPAQQAAQSYFQPYGFYSASSASTPHSPAVTPQGTNPLNQGQSYFEHTEEPSASDASYQGRYDEQQPYNGDSYQYAPNQPSRSNSQTARTAVPAAQYGRQYYDQYQQVPERRDYWYDNNFDMDNSNSLPQDGADGDLDIGVASQTSHSTPHSTSQLTPADPLDPVAQLEHEIELDRHLLEGIEPVSEEEDALARRRSRYKPKSSIPPDVSSTNYAAQCIAAAVSSRLPPYRLHPGEYTLLRPHLSARHVTTYLNIRNGVLRLWLANPTVNVTRVEAAGCVRDERYYGLAEFAFEWLLRNGYINHGCVEPSAPDPAYRPSHAPTARRKPRQTILIIGAGIAGLSCARQLHALTQRYRHAFSAEYEDIPRVVVLEARRRIGGRVHTVALSTEDESGGQTIADLGADTIQGFGGGNPLGTVLRRQLGLPILPADLKNDLFEGTSGDKIDPTKTYRAHELFVHMLDRLALFESGMPEPKTAMGDKTLIRAARDPPVGDETEEARTIAKKEELERPYDDPGLSPSAKTPSNLMTETAVETKFLRELEFTTKDPAHQIHISSLPAGGAGSLGESLAGFVDQLREIAQLDDGDVDALGWYYSKFENMTGCTMEKMSLNAFSHHRKNRFTGRHAWVRDGFSSLARGLASVPLKLDVRFKTHVTVVEYDNDSAMCTLGNGEQIQADRVVVSVPLGILKRRSMQFIPDLPHWKTDSIERLEYGCVNKVVLLFDKVFWDEGPTWNVVNKAESAAKGECFMFQNMAGATGKPLIVGLVCGKGAQNLSKHNDAEIVGNAVARLKSLFKVKDDDKEAPKLVESVVTRWQLDPLSLGTHSYVGVEGTVVDHDLLGRPVMQSLFFAGEATSRLYPGTVHGAYLSGLRAAKDVINSLLGPIDIPEPLIPGTVSSVPPPVVAPVPRRGPSPMPNPVRSTSVPSRPATGLGGTPTGMPYQAVYGPYGPAARHPHPHPHPTRLGLTMAASRPHTRTPVDISEMETELANLRHDRLAEENSQMERDLELELGERPTRPERGANTNPFLLFQKDYWDICRQERDEQKRQERKGGRATRNEIRATLGKRWKTLPDEEKEPYISRTQKLKEENEQKSDDYLRRIKWYEAEADNFRQQWKLDHPSKPSDRELELQEIIEEFHPKKKRSRLLE